MFSHRNDGEDINFKCLKDNAEQYKHLISFFKKEQLLSDIAILYRNNISAIPLADELERNNIPFYIREYKINFFKHWVTTDIVSFINLSLNLNDINAFEKIYYKMDAFLSKVMFEYIAAYSDSSIDLFDKLLTFPELTAKTYHKIKDIKKNFIKMKKLSPPKLIEFIVDTLGYGAYLKRKSKEGDFSSDGLMQIVNSLKSISKHTEKIHKFLNRLDELQTIMNNARFNKGKNAVILSTIHSSKGLEFDKVFLIDLYDGQFPSFKNIKEYEEGNKTSMEEEVRLFYVGVTRAKNYLELLSAKWLNDKQVKASRFFEYLLPESKKEIQKAEFGLSKYQFKQAVSEEDICVDTLVQHKKFGVGTIRFMNFDKDLLDINFEKSGLRTFSLKACLKRRLIRLVDDKSSTE